LSLSNGWVLGGEAKARRLYRSGLPNGTSASDIALLYG